MKTLRLLVLSLVLLPLALQAQSLEEYRERPLPYPVTPDPFFERAVENGTRTETGEPGPNYWTNTADYEIEATLDPETNMLSGAATIQYQNDAPDELPQLVLHLRQNLHEEGAVRNRPVQVTGGMEVTSVSYNGTALEEQESAQGVGYAVVDTRLVLFLPEPLSSGESGTVEVEWSFEVPEAGAPRMGREDGVFYLGYWYPQMAVYDDLQGWTAEPYQGNGEFYMGYGSYDVSVTVPEGWLVAATGTLQNPEEVLTETTRERLAQAEETDEVVSIAGENERGTTTLEGTNGELTWRFQADEVRDFAFSASDQYVWDATTAETGDEEDGTATIHALYRPDASSWNRAAEFAQFSIEHLSDLIFPYPYPHMTVVEGIIGGGMEYPMITVIGGERTDRSLFGVTYHEISHMWFPMLVGSNEKRYTWMDEGTTSFNTNEGTVDFFDVDAWNPQEQNYYALAGSGGEVPSMRHADEYPYGSPARVIASYNKPAVVLHALRGILGEEQFLEAYRTYAENWTYKHPTPHDFFNTFEEVAGRDLDWFWTPMFYETWTVDHAVANVEENGETTTITIEDRGRAPMPVPVQVTYEDGTTSEHEIPVETWLEGARTATVETDEGTVAEVELDPEQYIPDVNRTNNTWARETASPGN